MSLGSLFRRSMFIGAALIMAPIAYINRHDAEIFLNPFYTASGEDALHIPVFLVILTCFFAGAAGGYLIGRWQGRGKRAVSSDPA